MNRIIITTKEYRLRKEMQQNNEAFFVQDFLKACPKILSKDCISNRFLINSRKSHVIQQERAIYESDFPCHRSRNFKKSTHKAS